ncbi:hypothetical protein C8J56DRAFT_1161360 [Mycena floridula]|nr:hypothetical protein C8J56DRAFT_1161360 [Mycena floridula]
MSATTFSKRKVAELRDILAKADITVSARLTKAELISRIIASPAAIKAHDAMFPSTSKPSGAGDKPVCLHSSTLMYPTNNHQFLPLPDDSNASNTVPVPAVEPPAVEPSVAEPQPLATQPTTLAESTIDAELEKRKQRAARFNIPLVEPSKPAAKKEKKAATQKPTEVKEKRVEAAPGVSKRKRGTGAPVVEEVVDAEEQERRKKRAARFGASVETNT